MSSKAREADIEAPLHGAKVTALPGRVPANAPVTAGHGIPRNPGMALDLGFLESMRNVNRSALERRVASLTKRRSIKGDNQAAWLLRAVACMDLTTLNSNDTEERVRRLCAKAVNPFRRDIVEALGIEAARDPPGRGLRLSPLRRHRRRGGQGHRHPCRRRLHRLPARACAARHAPAGDRSLGRRRRRRDRRRHPARPGVRRALAGALRRDRRHARRLRRGASEGHPRHRRPGDTAQRHAGLDGGDDGRRRFRQDLDRQGERQRDAAGRSRDGRARSAPISRKPAT